MYLVEAKPAEPQQAREPKLASERWESFPYSQLSHHGEACCEVAREWIKAMDFAQLNGADLTSGPRWIRSRYKWGPSEWPMHWCEVVKRKTIDCGAHAALSREAFAGRGLVAFPTQLVQRYTADSVEQWRGSWGQEKVSCHWLDGEHIYHEVASLLVGDNEVKIWDGSAGAWVDPRQPQGGYGSLVAVRIHADPDFVQAEGFAWGDRRIRANAWQQMTA